jgi:hypothetical protein
MKPALAVAPPLIQLLHQMLQISCKYHLLPKFPLLVDATLPILWAQIGSHETGKLFREVVVTHLNYVYGTSAIHCTSRLGVSRIDLGAEYPLTYSWPSEIMLNRCPILETRLYVLLGSRKSGNPHTKPNQTSFLAAGLPIFFEYILLLFTISYHSIS